MIILAVGDIVGSPGTDFFCERIGGLRRLFGADMVVANAENSAYSGVGVNRSTATALFRAGADVLTTGNHAFRSRDYREVFEENALLLRPANYAAGIAGRGAAVCDLGRYRVGVINLSGQSFMESCDNYYDALDRALAEMDTRLILVDFHAEATAEKLALAHYADGRVSALFGTHTHVQTADEQVLPQGTGYITDLGMTGPADAVLGIRPECSIQKQRFKLPTVFEVAGGDCRLCGALFDIDEATGRCRSVERVAVR